MSLLRRATRRLRRAVLTATLPRTEHDDLVRLGSDYGGWWVPASAVGPGRVAYCAGAGTDITFDIELLDAGCDVVTLDPTPRAIEFVQEHAPASDRFTFVPIGLWSEATTLRFYAPADPTHVSHSATNLQGTTSFFEATVETVPSVMDRMAHRSIDILKLDIEGAEFEVLDSLLRSGTALPGVVCVEFDQPVSARRIRRQVRALHRAGYELNHIEHWNYTFTRVPGSDDRPAPVAGRASAGRLASLLGKVRYASRMRQNHPGVRENPNRFYRRLASWRLLTWLGRDATVGFDRYGVRFWCPSEWRGMSKMAYTLRDRCEEEMTHLGRWVSAGDVVVDAGAHYGSYTVALAALVGEKGAVVAVEPSPHALAVLRRNVELNGQHNVEIVRAGLGEREETATLRTHDDASRTSLETSSSGGGDVAIRRLDDVVPSTTRVAFIKIDVEGSETAALMGAQRILSLDRPVVQFEILPAAAASSPNAWEVLADHGYDFLQLDADGSYIEVGALAERRSPNVMAVPRS